MRKILPVIALFVFSIYFSVSAFGQSPDPSNCDNGDTTSWENPLTGWTINIPAEVLGCDDPDCVVTIEYYKRHTSWGWEFTITKITFSSTCDNDCINNAWRTALWMLAVRYQTEMELEEIDDCYNNFIYRLATCWQKVTTYGMVSYTACGSDCCSGVYDICLRLVNGDKKIEIQRVSELQPITFNCTSPCEFKECSELMPLNIIVDTHRPDNSAYEVFPKQSIYNQESSNSMELRPNPAINSINIRIAVPESGVYKLNVVDNIGSTVHSQSINVGKSLEFELDLTTQEYHSGNYNVVLTNNSGLILNQKFIKIK